MKAAVADTTLLSNFAHVKRPDLPLIAFPKLIVPGVVLREIAQGERLRLLPVCDWSLIPRAEPDERALSIVEHLRPTLDEGELACLALASRLSAVVVTDDRAARQAAHSLGLEVSGTLGALCNLVNGDHLSTDEADQLLNKMRARGYRSPVSSLIELLPSP